MDKKKTLTSALFLLGSIVFLGVCASAQNPARLQFCDRSYNYGPGNDSIKIYFNIFGEDGKRISRYKRKGRIYPM